MKIFLSFLIFSFIANKLIFSQDIKFDTSFTIYSAADKVLQQYPYTKLVLPEKLEGIVEQKNIVYKQTGNRNLRLDIFAPKKKNHKLFPGVLLIHGGGWSSGNKSQQIPLAQRLSCSSYVTAAVEYRLSPEALYPAAVQDLKAAIKWMKAHLKEYNLDTNKIAVLGCSAGGQLAALIGTTNSNKKFEENNYLQNSTSNIHAIIDIDGILDFTHPAESGKDTDLAKPSSGKRWFGASFKDKPELWIEASPLNYVDKNTPPTLFINSSIDRFHAGRDEYIKELQKWNIYYEVHTIPDTPHPFWLFHPWFEDTLNYTLNFLNKVFK